MKNPKFFSCNIIILIILSLMISSCTPVGKGTHGPFLKKEQVRTEPSENIMKMISSGEYNLAESKLLKKITEDPSDIRSRKMLGYLYYRTGNFERTEKVIGSILSDKPDIFKNIEKNEEFDLFYIYTSSLLRLNKLSTAGNYLFSLDNTDMLSAENLIKYKFLNIELDHRSGNIDYIKSKISDVLKERSLNNSLRLNLYYILAASNIKMNNPDEALDNTIFLVLNDPENNYTKKAKRLLDEIVNISNEDVLDRLRSKIADAYRQLAERTKSNLSLNQKILRSVNVLENSSVTVNTGHQENNGSYISRMELFTDRDETTIVISSQDSVNYINPPLYDGKTLTLRLPDKKIDSDKRSMKPTEGSGIESVTWESRSDTLELKITLSENLPISIEKLSGGYFEQNANVRENYSVKLNVQLPEQSMTGIPEFDTYDDRYTIVLDPGHGGIDPGAVSIMKKSDGSKYTEKEMNLMICKELKDYLEKEGCRVFLTRNRDYYPTLHERNRIAQNRNADMFISVHLNSASKRNEKLWQTSRYYGAEMIIRESLGYMPEFINFKNANKSDWKMKRQAALAEHKKLSKILSMTVPSALDSPFNKKRRIKKKKLAIFSGMTVPHALIETGFIMNNKNLKYLLSRSGRTKLYKGIFDGIEQYRRSSYQEK